jgi:hypothetical protein
MFLVWHFQVQELFVYIPALCFDTEQVGECPFVFQLLVSGDKPGHRQ